MNDQSFRRRAGALALVFALCLQSVTVSAATVTKSITGGTYSSSTGGANTLLVNGKTVTLSGITVRKTGSGSGENADFYGTNAAILAKNKARVTIKSATVTTNGSYANGIFSYGSGTTVVVKNTKITTKANNSGGLMTTGGGTTKATNCKVTTSGNSSAAIRSDRGGGTVTVNKGTYTTSGVGSPAIYSTAKITVSNSTLKATKSEAVVVEGGNSVTLKNDKVIGNNSKLNGQSKVKTNVMIYQSMSGDASSGTSAFTMTGGSMTAKTGCMFYVTNTTTKINLTNVKLTNSSSGRLLTVAAGPWGRSGSNGGHVTMNASAQTLKGTIAVDSSSSLKLVLKKSSTFTGAISGKETVAVTVPSGCKWKLTGNSTISSLKCAASSIDLNGYTLTVNGKKYTSGTAA